MILGLDPGIRHTGWGLVDNGKPRRWGLWLTPGTGKLTSAQVLAFVLPNLDTLVAKYNPTYAAVEEVVWQGIRRRITFPLAHVAGGLVGFLVARGVRVLIVSPSMKNHQQLKLRGNPSEHELDAIRLALRAHDADTVAEDSSLSRRSLATARKIIAVRSVPSLSCPAVEH